MEQKTITLETLLRMDEEFPHELALSDCVGDSYLYANNAIYRKIRNLVLDLGFTPSSQISEMWLDYNAFSLLTLTDILESRVLPYCSNKGTLQRMARRSPQWRPGALLVRSFRHNYLLHESAHCIAYDHLQKNGFESSTWRSRETYVLLLLLCEAYANTMERLASIHALLPMDKLLFSLNSWVNPGDSSLQFLSPAVRALGWSEAFSVCMITFFLLNIHSGDLPQSASRALMLSFCGSEEVTDARSAVVNMLVTDCSVSGLSKTFRSETTPAFFQYIGCAEHFSKYTKMTFEPNVLESLGVRSAIAAMAELTDGNDFECKRERSDELYCQL